MTEVQEWWELLAAWKATVWLMSTNILDYTQDEKALKGACDCSQGKFVSLPFQL